MCNLFVSVCVCVCVCVERWFVAYNTKVCPSQVDNNPPSDSGSAPVACLIALHGPHAAEGTQHVRMCVCVCECLGESV